MILASKVSPFGKYKTPRYVRKLPTTNINVDGGITLKFQFWEEKSETIVFINLSFDFSGMQMQENNLFWCMHGK